MKLILDKIILFVSRFKQRGLLSSYFKSRTNDDLWQESIALAREELSIELSKVNDRLEKAREINAKVKSGIPLSKDEDKFLGILRI
nr:hypothetical protein [uncultured Allomuricauda sp.]